MADTLKDFLVSIGFSVDEAARKRAEAAVQQSEAKLTDATVTELARRQRAEDKALADRVNAITSVGGELDAEEKAAAARFVKTQADRADKDRKIQEEAAKKTRERRDSAFKEAQKFALQFAAFATKAALAIEATALGIVYATDKAAKSFDQLNYAAQRIGAAPRSISAFAYAISQLGGSVEGANSSLEEFGQKLKGPAGAGFEQMLNNLGVKTRDAAGKLRDSAVIATDALQELAKRPVAESMNYAKVFGFDDLTRRAGGDPRLGQFEEQYRSDQAKVGADPDAAARGGTAFEQSMRHLEEVSSAVATKIETNLFKKIQPLLDKLGDWIAANGEDIATIMSDIADKLVRFATAMGDAFAKVDWDAVLKKVDKFFTEFDKRAREIFGKDGLTAVFEAFGLVLGVSVLGKLTGILNALRLLGGVAMPTWLLRMLGIAGVIGLGASAESTPGAGISSDPAIRGQQETENKQLTDEYNQSHGQGKGFWHDTWNWAKGKLGIGGGSGHGGPGALNTKQQKDNAAAVADEMRKAGMPDEAIAATLGSVQTESTFNPLAHNDVAGGHDGIIQWDKNRWPKIKAWIVDQGGDPNDIRWQTKAFIAEGRARPGERLYDSAQTQRGFQALEQSKGNMDQANAGIRSIERFGFGEEGGRAAHARAWLDHLPTAGGDSTAPAPPAAGGDPEASAPPTDEKAKPVPWHRGMPQPSSPDTREDGRPRHVFPKDKNGDPIGGIPHSYEEVEDYLHELMKKYRKPPEQPAMPTLKAPLGITPSVTSSILNNNSRTKGDTTITHSPVFHIQGGDVTANLRAAQIAAGRGVPDWLANMQGAEQ